MPSDTLSRREFVERLAALGVGAALIPAALEACAGGPPAPALSGGAGVARFTSSGGTLTLENDRILASWQVDDGVLRALRFADRTTDREVQLPGDLFSLRLANGDVLRASSLQVRGEPRAETLASYPGAARWSERLTGQRLTAEMEDPAGRLRATWRALLRDGSRYIRQELVLRPGTAALDVREITLLDLAVPGAAVSGSVRGSPVVAGNLFLAFEHPLSQSTVEGAHVRCVLPRTLPLRATAPVTVSLVLGTTPIDQLRRGFLDYIERERAHPYRTFLHYNSWYDLGYFNPYDEASALEVIEAFGSELHARRGVTLDSFLFDDGWDDHRTLWHFNSGFPDGFTRVREATARYGAAPGVWMSPWGGYGQPRQERLQYGRQEGFETNERGFALSGPKYYARFRDTCLEMIRKYGVNQFKFDGTGSATRTIPGSNFDSDFDAAIHLIEELRTEKPDLYVNLTTGTYPSPFWLRYADSIWRGGSDHSFAGVGSQRQQWITYRDGDTHRGVVGRGPLFPLNSLMLHGLIYARYAKNLDSDPLGDFRAEVRSYFGTGTQLQEMYITHSLLSRQNWDDLAEAARWSRRHADILVDTHWIGGDPLALEPYGWAAWSPAGAILTLRNPRDLPQPISLDVATAFELPTEAPERYLARSPWQDGRGQSLELRAGEVHRFDLEPFQVLTLVAQPR